MGLSAASIEAQRIDFETVPGDTPVEFMSISTQFLVSHGIEFRLAGGGSPVLAEVGRPTVAFQPSDTPAADQGSFFLTDDGLLNQGSQDLIVEYETPSSFAGGVILDVDASEIFTIEARNELDEVIATVIIESGDPLTGDQQSTPWSISRPSADISSIRFSGDSQSTRLFGLAFDDFTAYGPNRLFGSGFETGNFMAWTSSTP